MLRLLLLIGLVVLVGYMIMYNRKLTKVLIGSKERSEGVFYRLLGQRVKGWNTSIERTSTIKKDSWISKVNNYFKDIIINLGMAKDNVTPIGLVTFIASISVAFSILFYIWSRELLLTIPAFGAIFFFFVVLFNFISLLKYEKKELELMDTEDLIAMDVKGGVYNAIVRYRHSFHPNIQPHFEEFIDNIRGTGYSFENAMRILNERLGSSFTDFAQKAVLYERKADDDMDDIFSAVVEMNRNKRNLRYENNIKFDKLRFEFIISMVIIAGYGLFSVLTDPFIANFFGNTIFGKLLILADIVAITLVLSYIASIKAKFL